MKIIFIDDHKIFGESLKMLLEEREENFIIDYVSDIDLFLSKLKNSTYEIAIIDINLKDKKTGLDLIKDVKLLNEELKIIILTSYDLMNYKELAHKYGANAFINKSVDVDNLVAEIHKVYKGENIFEEEELVDRLTDREIEVLKELSKGKTKKETASDLFISERTLYNHIANIYEKIDVSNTVQAINRAKEIGYIDDF
ncbi:response regulator transcription factor [Peptoniphilus sp. MSJ-1]|uniref:Response regulator transcription factor n=1 Tax=Peptoniphilus ovalis TaxID=2841503 RepID=A0ABS6FG63_9FIRM|nr:response regulator transcription factor [Peptoniphilus ovalis]MBU5668220.1 response regulator transcription factor [Peptoniphilus ovalis]